MKNSKNKILIIIMLIAAAGLFGSCGNKNIDHTQNKDSKTDTTKSNSSVITKEEQAALTPDAVIDKLKKGNERYVKGDLTAQNIPKQIMESSKGQYPKAVVLSCLDSRVPVESVFNQSIGDLFVARVAGNFVNPDILGSMEFGCKVSGAKLILVLGHSDCGAIKGAIDNVNMGNLTGLLEKIRPAVDSLKSFNGDKSSKNKEFVQKVCDENVKLTINNIRKNSPILKEMEDKGEIKIVGAVYALNDGKVTFFEK